MLLTSPPCSIHRSACKVHSANFAITELSEVRIAPVLRQRASVAKTGCLRGLTTATAPEASGLKGVALTRDERTLAKRQHIAPVRGRVAHGCWTGAIRTSENSVRAKLRDTRSPCTEASREAKLSPSARTAHMGRDEMIILSSRAVSVAPPRRRASSRWHKA